MHKSNRETHSVTCSSVTGQRSLTFTYRNLVNFWGFYSLNGKPHKKSIQVGTPTALPVIDGGLNEVEKHNP